MLKEHDNVIRKFIQTLDALVILLAFVMAYYLRTHFSSFYKLDILPWVQVISSTPPFLVPISRYIGFIAIVVPIWIIILRFTGAYKSFRTYSFIGIAWIVLKSAAYLVIASGTISFVFKIQYVSRLLFIIFIFLSTLLLMIERFIIIAIIHYIRRKGYNYRRLLMVGSGQRAQNFMHVIENHPEWGFKIIGIIEDDRAKIGQKIMGYDILGVLEDMQSILHKRMVDEVIFIVPRSWLDKIQNSVALCELEGVKATIAADLFNLNLAHSVQSELEGMPFMSFETTPGKEWQLFIKRTTDITISALGLVLLFPFFLIIAVLIKLTSKGPILFAQRRIGRNGKKFVLYKFRSMYYGAHRRLQELEKLNEASGPVFKMKNDPRLTRIGRFMRKLSIDELPQLFNVFMGHMSLVGPRPPLPREVQKYEPWQRRRLSMLPGLTCLWQICGRSNVDFNKWMKMDLEYIDNWSLWLDFKIVLKTIPVVIFGIGAR